MKQSTSKVLIILLCFFVLISPAFMIAIPFSLANSGVFAVYVSDIFAVAIWCIIFIKMLSKSNRQKVYDWYSLIFIIFILFGTCVTLYRFSIGERDFDSTIVLRISVMTYWIYLMFKLNMVNLELFEKSYILFVFVFVMFSFFLALDYTVFENTFMQNLSTRSTVQIILFGITSMFYFNRYSRMLSLLLMFQIFGLVAASLITGSRINAISIPILILIFVALSLWQYGLKSLQFILAAVLSVLVVFSLLVTSNRIEAGLNRNFITRNIVDDYKSSSYYNFTYKLLSKDDDNPNNNESDDDSIKEEAENSIEDSTNSRLDIYERAIKDILTNPIIGPGYQLYDYTYTQIENKVTVTIPAHNFVLEYSLAYGFFGTTLFILFSFLESAVLLKSSLFDKRHNYSINLMFISTLGLVLVISMFQPIFVNTIPLFYLYLLLGVYRIIEKSDL